MRPLFRSLKHHVKSAGPMGISALAGTGIGALGGAMAWGDNDTIWDKTKKVVGGATIGAGLGAGAGYGIKRGMKPLPALASEGVHGRDYEGIFHDYQKNLQAALDANNFNEASKQYHMMVQRDPRDTHGIIKDSLGKIRDRFEIKHTGTHVNHLSIDPLDSAHHYSYGGLAQGVGDRDNLTHEYLDLVVQQGRRLADKMNIPPMPPRRAT